MIEVIGASLVVALLTRMVSGSSSVKCTSTSSYFTIRRNHDRFLQDAPSAGNEETSQSDVKEYYLLQPVEFKNKLDHWNTTYPDLIKVTTSQEKYGLPAAGHRDDCLFYEGTGCPNYVLTIQDYLVHPEDSESSNRLPEVFWSGCLHGDERVGPTAVMEATELLLEAAHCEGLPRYQNQEREGYSMAHSDSHENQVEEAKECRKKLQAKGIGDVHRKWLARLVTTRRIVAVPTTNALGYFRHTREEGTVDPNRDFPYDVEDPAICMQTIAGRTLNEIYREHLFQLALTFHAGTEVVGYEWGAPTWLSHLSPDDKAQYEVASAYSRFGGGWSLSRPYQFGTMNDLVYWVRGGMEDWAYAGSWDPSRVIACKPTSFGGYPEEKTRYNNSTLRVFNMLIETSNSKEPRKADLGTSLDVLRRDTKGNGHVSRNIRLALLSADLVEPYVSIVGINDLALADDLPPLSTRGGQSCRKTRAFSIAKNAAQIQVQFTVGGAMSIDNVELWYAKWDDITGEQLDCLMQPETTDFLSKGSIIGAKNGTGKFSVAGAHPRPDKESEIASRTNGPIFTGTITLPSNLNPLDELVVVASARVDQSWKSQPSNIAPNMGPQSHIVNVRTDSNWRHDSAGKQVRGRLDWFSNPVTVVIGDFTDSVGTQGEQPVRTVEMYPRFGGGTKTSGMRPKSAEQSQLGFPLQMWVVLVVGLGSLVFCMYCFMTRSVGVTDRRMRTQIPQDDGFDFDSKPYSDRAGSSDDEDENGDGVELGTMG